jgi:hypothetical protein
MKTVTIYFRTGETKSFTEGKEHVTKINSIELDNNYPIVSIQLDNGSTCIYYGLSYAITTKNNLPTTPKTK